MPHLFLCVLCASVFPIVLCDPCVAQDFSTAETLRLKGRYEEAFEQFSQAKSSPAQVVGQARCLAATGKTDESILRLETFLETEQHNDVETLLARYYFELGNHKLARRHVDAVLKREPSSIQARFLDAKLQHAIGKVEQAKATYAELSKTSLRNLSLADAEVVCEATAIHGRWMHDTKVFDRLVNELYPQLLGKDASAWRAHLASGKLFLEKYNDADASRELSAALAINPRAAEVHVALGRLAIQGFEIEKAIGSAERALKINPKLVAALQLTADIAFVNLQPHSALEPLNQARASNAIDEGTIGRLLAVYLRADGLDTGTNPSSRAAKLTREVQTRNAACGQFYAATAEAMNDMRIYPLANEYYKRAIEASPELTRARGSLGMVQMRLGEEVDARKSLEESFKIDPFNVRVKNTLDVLDLLDTYAVLETEHFILRFDRGHDGVLAEYAARFLEDEVYPDIVAALGYEPKDKTLLEIFSKANGTSGHSWFSARMVGLPFIGTVGACAGKMFALTSPDDGQRYNWARVLRHEFVHVVNLQQTNFLIPHWFTEAIAVRNEAVDYPGDWERILAKYVAEDALFTLKNINHGFVRPGSGERWTLAYFQSYLYADFILQKAGPDALQKMLRLYADGKNTTEVIKAVTNSSVGEFEAEYLTFLKDRTKDFRGSVATSNTVEELDSALSDAETDNEKAKLLAQLAQGLARSGQTRKARRQAEAALELDAQQPIANLVMARLLSSIGDDDKAWEHIEVGLEAEKSDSKLLAFAANLKLSQKKYNEAADYYRQGETAFPYDINWTRGLARVLLKSGKNEELQRVLAKLADREADKTPFARKLTLLALDNEDYVAAEKWATRVLNVEIMNPLSHAQLAEALAGQDKLDEAIREYEMALKLSPNDKKWQSALEKLRKRQK